MVEHEKTLDWNHQQTLEQCKRAWGKNYPPSSGQMESSHFTFTSIGTLKPRQGHGPISRSQNWGSPGHSLWKLGQSSMNQTFNSQRRQPGFPMGRTPPSWSNFCWGGKGCLKTIRRSKDIGFKKQSWYNIKRNIYPSKISNMFLNLNMFFTKRKTWFFEATIVSIHRLSSRGWMAKPSSRTQPVTPPEVEQFAPWKNGGWKTNEPEPFLFGMLVAFQVANC